MRRRLTTALTLGALALTVSACYNKPINGVKDPNACDPVFTAGAVSNEIATAAGSKLPEELRVDPESAVTQVQATVKSVQQSDKAKAAVSSGQQVKKVKTDELVSVAFTIYDGGSGQALNPQSSSVFVDMQLDVKGVPKTLLDMLTCQETGSRVTAVLPPSQSAELFAGFNSAALQADPTQPQHAVIVADIYNTGSKLPAGANKSLPAGYPAVTAAPNGRPGVVIPPTPQPTESTAAALIEGTGSELKADQGAVVNILHLSWQGIVLENTWDTAPEPIAAENTLDTHVIRPLLTGFPVGSRVVVMVPEPAADTTHVYVVDILLASN